MTSLRVQEGAAGVLSVAELLAEKAERLGLELLTPEADLTIGITDPEISSPGLALAGFTARATDGRPLVFGQTEMAYLDSLDDDAAADRLRALFSFDIPVVFVTKDQKVPAAFLEIATANGVPVILSRVSTKDFYLRIKPFLEAALAISTHLHGSLASIYGVGVLFVGPSGVGKSECVLDLVERGHRLVADDLVLVSRRGDDVLLGKGHELQRHHMEIRGLGIIDIKALFGIRAIRHQKRLEVVVHLETWEEGKEYTRSGLDSDTTEILGVKVPSVTVPLNPGKNITVIAEVVAMNHLLAYSGINSAAAFDQRIRDSMQPVRDYLVRDYE